MLTAKEKRAAKQGFMMIGENGTSLWGRLVRGRQYL